ncbi:MAG TPA: EFR1 family ferrodoxin [Clostridia bacterium]|nr:EFR1 family ferrodoxin [Clostridia bacterium]
MKILYFSGTGNSFATARLIGRGDALIVDMALSRLENIEDEVVGIVVPCYCADIPDKARNFLKKVNIKSDYIFAVVTCGASAGNCFATINGILKEKGLKLSYYKKLVLPDSCIIFATKTEQAKKMLSAHKEKAKEIRSDIDNKVTMKPVRDKKTPTPYTKFMWKSFKSFYKIENKKTNGRCIACGRCVEYCPVKNIYMKDKKIIFGNSCENCFGCIQRCDKMAIRFGKIEVTNATRYYHPVLSEDN